MVPHGQLLLWAHRLGARCRSHQCRDTLRTLLDLIEHHHRELLLLRDLTGHRLLAPPDLIGVLILTKRLLQSPYAVAPGEVSVWSGWRICSQQNPQHSAL